MSPVESSQLKSAGYDQDSDDLYIEFKTGVVYRYSEVPPEVFEKLTLSSSAGSYFAANIKGNYEYKKLDLLVDPEHNLTLKN